MIFIQQVLTLEGAIVILNVGVLIIRGVIIIET